MNIAISEKNPLRAFHTIYDYYAVDNGNIFINRSWKENYFNGLSLIFPIIYGGLFTVK